ncbi:MAG: hypothetical protein WCB97_09255, partial [Thiobacillus sp.]
MLKGAWEQLPLQVNGNESGAGVNVLVAGQGVAPLVNSKAMLMHLPHWGKMHEWNFFYSLV